MGATRAGTAVGTAVGRAVGAAAEAGRGRTRRGAVGGLVAALLTLIVLVPAASGAGRARSLADEDPEDPRPNVVLVLTDDMRWDDLAWMPQTKHLLGQFRRTQFLSNHPLCCPARAEILTGQYAQHNGVFHNTGPFGGDQALRQKDNTLAAWLFDAGYRTGFTGKWLNWWDPADSVRPHGWTHFNPWIDDPASGGNDVYSPFDYTSYNDGDLVKPRVHTNDAVTDSAVSQIKEFAEGPFFVYASYVAPHGMSVDAKWVPPVPAQRHVDLFSDVVPSYQDKPSFDYGTEGTQRFQRVWRQRIRSLQSVDDGVRSIVDTLRETGELDNTVIVFVSDNGLLLGEHQAYDKNLPWEEALRVPLLARGPGIATGRATRAAMMVDLAPSIARLTGVTPRRAVDGRAGLFTLDGGWNDALIQGGSNDYTQHFRWRGTRTPRWTYVDWIGRPDQLFDRVEDPYQLHNLARHRPKVRAALARRTPDPY